MPPEALVRPVPVVVHCPGGVWDRSREDSAFIADGLYADGIAVAVVGVEHGRRIDVRRVIGQVRRAIDHLTTNADDLGIDPRRIVVVAGGSGAHAAVMAALSHGPRSGCSGLLLISGLYDLTPLIGTSINERCHCSPVDAVRLSPMMSELAGLPQVVIAVGRDDPAGLRSQTDEFAARLFHSGVPCRLVEGGDQFALLTSLADGSSALGWATRRLVGALPPS